MAFQSRLFSGDAKLEAASKSNPAHILRWAVGDHVAKIQYALITLDNAVIDNDELSLKRYGRTTAEAVLSYKKRRNIINYSYETQADNIVGIMTMAVLDKEMVKYENTPSDVSVIRCCVRESPRRGRA